MNSVYQNMRREFEPDESYQGSEVHGVILNTIKVRWHVLIFEVFHAVWC